MKVYEKIIIDMMTGRMLAEVSYEYDGPVALCKKDTPDPPPPPPPPKPPQDMMASAKSAKEEQAERLRKAYGQRGTIVTSGKGLTEKAVTSKKKLLSGVS